MTKNLLVSYFFLTELNFYSAAYPLDADNVKKILNERVDEPMQAVVNDSSHRDINDHMRLGKQKKGWTVDF